MEETQMYIKIHLEKKNNRAAKSVPPNRCSAICCTHFQVRHQPITYAVSIHITQFV